MANNTNVRWHVRPIRSDSWTLGGGHVDAAEDGNGWWAVVDTNQPDAPVDHIHNNQRLAQDEADRLNAVKR